MCSGFKIYEDFAMYLGEGWCTEGEWYSPKFMSTQDL